MAETIEVQDPYTSYVNVKIVDLWYETYIYTIKERSTNIVGSDSSIAKSIADQAVKNFKDFLQGV